MRLLSRNGTDWTKRYLWIAEAALKNRQKRFVIDGEAVILGVDGISDFNALHSASAVPRRSAEALDQGEEPQPCCDGSGVMIFVSPTLSTPIGERNAAQSQRFCSHSQDEMRQMPRAEAHASAILREYDEAETELIGKAVVLTDGTAGTVEELYLDEAHGLRLSIAGHPGKWPVATIKLAQK